MPSSGHRQDFAAAVVLATLAFGLFAYRADDRPQTANEKPLNAAVDLLAARHGRDDAGRFLPLFVRVSSELWLPPVPVYITLAVANVRRVEQPGRQAAAVLGAIGVVLTYVFASAVLGQRAFGWIAAILLLCNPAYMESARSAALDGVWVIPPLLLSLIAVRRFAEAALRRSLAIGAGALVVCVYAQPSGAALVAIVGATMWIGLGKARLLTARDALCAAGAAAAAALPIALWFAIHPASYIDTLGSWFLHPAYIRHPSLLALRLMNWFSLAEWASIYWNVFDPTHLLYDDAGPASAGTFLMAFAMLWGVAANDLARSQRPRSTQESALLWIVAVGFVASPLVPASFAKPGAIQMALSLPLFGTILGALGVRALWTRQSKLARVAAVALLGVALVQFVAFYRALVIR